MSLSPYDSLVNQDDVKMPAFKKSHLYAAGGAAFAIALGAIALSTQPNTDDITPSLPVTDSQSLEKQASAPNEAQALSQSADEPQKDQTKQPTETNHEPDAVEYERRETCELNFPISEDHEFAISLFDDVNFHITFDQVHRLQEGQTLAQGHLAGHELATVTVTQLKDRYLMSIQDMEHDLIYRISGDFSSGKADVIEVDLKKMPAQVHEH
jgi:hypothetical protein